MRMDRGNPCSISESLERIFIGTRALNLSPHIAGDRDSQQSKNTVITLYIAGDRDNQESRNTVITLHISGDRGQLAVQEHSNDTQTERQYKKLMKNIIFALNHL